MSTATSSSASFVFSLGAKDASVAKPSAHTDAGLPSLSCVGTPCVALEECISAQLDGKKGHSQSTHPVVTRP
jgi:hypothetical protein